MSTPSDWGENCEKPFQKVRHADLYRVGGSAYQSMCPTCKKGHLMMTREPKSLALLRHDRCTYCLQGFIYIDPNIAGETLQLLPTNFEVKAAKVSANLAKGIRVGKSN